MPLTSYFFVIVSRPFFRTCITRRSLVVKTRKRTNGHCLRCHLSFTLLFFGLNIFVLSWRWENPSGVATCMAHYPKNDNPKISPLGFLTPNSCAKSHHMCKCREIGLLDLEISHCVTSFCRKALLSKAFWNLVFLISRNLKQ